MSVGLGGLWVSKNAADAARDSAEAAKASANSAEQSFLATNRPYIGVERFETHYCIMRVSGCDQVVRKFADTMAVEAFVKNFGTVPGTDVVAEYSVKVAGIEQAQKKFPDRPSTLFPQHTVTLGGQADPADYPDIVRGTKSLEFEFRISYSGPVQQYKYCEDFRFAPELGHFVGLGNCPQQTVK
jgi:hypothetical protein